MGNVFSVEKSQNFRTNGLPSHPYRERLLSIKNSYPTAE
jgi:hypothetical protein